MLYEVITGLGAFLANDPRQLAGIDIGDADHVVALEVLGEGFLAAEIGGQQRQIPNDEALGMYAGGFFVFVVGAGIADMGIGEGHDLTGIRGVGQDFLIPRHRRIEDHFPNGTAFGADRNTFKYVITSYSIHYTKLYDNNLLT